MNLEQEDDDEELGLKMDDEPQPSRMRIQPPLVTVCAVMCVLIVSMILIVYLFALSHVQTAVIGEEFDPLPPPAVSPPVALVDSTKCIPQTCKLNKTFAVTQNFTLLVSFPGSSDAVVRATIEDGTKVWTGSLQHSRSLYRTGFQGEMLHPYAEPVSRFSVINTYFPYSQDDLQQSGDTGAIVFMRSPFDAILSEFTKEHGNHVSTNKSRELFPFAMLRGMIKWRTFAEFWLGNRMQLLKQRNGVSLMEYKRNIASNHTIRVLVVFHEDFVRRKVETTHVLLDFIKQEMQDGMPMNANEAMVCSLIAGNNVAEGKAVYNPYKDAESKVATRSMIQTACRLWEPFWIKSLWGKCTEALPQATRLPILQQHQRLTKINEYCDGGGKVNHLHNDYSMLDVSQRDVELGDLQEELAEIKAMLGEQDFTSTLDEVKNQMFGMDFNNA